MSGWNLPTDELKDVDYTNYEEKLFEPLPEAPKPVVETKLVDLASEIEKPKTYVPDETEEKPKDANKKLGLAPPVNIYEPGFRTDMYAALVNYFKAKRATKERNAELRAKMGMRR